MATPRRVGILTAGGDSPGLNAAIRAFGKAAIGTYGMEVVGFRDGFRGLAENRKVRLEKQALVRDPHRRRHDPRARAATSRTGCWWTARSGT